MMVDGSIPPVFAISSSFPSAPLRSVFPSPSLPSSPLDIPSSQRECVQEPEPERISGSLVDSGRGRALQTSLTVAAVPLAVPVSPVSEPEENFPQGATGTAFSAVRSQTKTQEVCGSRAASPMSFFLAARRSSRVGLS